MTESVLKTLSPVEFARQLALRKMLKLELVGMTRRGRSAYAIIKSETGLRGSKQKVYDDFTKMLQEAAPDLELTS